MLQFDGSVVPYVAAQGKRNGDTNASNPHTMNAIAQAALTSPSFGRVSASISKTVFGLWSEPRAPPEVLAPHVSLLSRGTIRAYSGAGPAPVSYFTQLMLLPR